MIRVNLCIGSDQDAAIRREAEKTGRPKTEIIRNLIDLGIKVKSRNFADLVAMSTHGTERVSAGSSTN